MISYTSYRNRFGSLSKNASSTNLTLADSLIADSLRYLITKFYFNEKSYTTTTVASQQFYNLPPQFDRMISVTVTIGTLLWPTKAAPSREYWDALNAVPYSNDFPSFHFIYGNNKVGIWPTPASSSNTITMNYKMRVTDLSQADYTTGTVTTINGSPNLTFATSVLNSNMVDRWIQVTAPTGDNKWYQILSVNTGAGTAILYNPYTGDSASTQAFVIGEMPILAEDYQDLALYRALMIYYTSIVPNTAMSRLYKDLYDTGYERLNQDFGQKSTSPVLTDTDIPIYNPNLFVNTIVGH